MPRNLYSESRRYSSTSTSNRNSASSSSSSRSRHREDNPKRSFRNPRDNRSSHRGEEEELKVPWQKLMPDCEDSRF